MMSPIQAMGDILKSKGYTVIIDLTVAGYIYMGISKPKTKVTEKGWAILRYTVTSSDSYYVAEWADGEGLEIMNKIWNSKLNYTYNYD